MVDHWLNLVYLKNLLLLSGWSGHIWILLVLQGNCTVLPGEIRTMFTGSAANKWLLKETQWFQGSSTKSRN